ncbi:glycoside hydrolase family protein [Roseburia hominis]|uniref:glycoside hydrolase family protein n=2 Tax=Roseburia hominis TaxID=301301 RepID=UPI00265AB7BE|nr:glycoside hydrolase family protein [Roseburia hominis]
MANKRIGQAGLDLIKQYEGCRLAAYRCAAGVWTIGYGHTAGVHSGMTITQAQADAYLQQDIAKFEGYVNNPAYVPITEQLNQNQFDALASFAFNLGAGNLRKLCKGRTAAQIARTMPNYNKAAGKVLAGLRRRRAAEQALFNKPVSGTAAPAQNQNTEDYNMKTIKKGSKGNAVKVWQIIIGAAADGIFGSGTESATKTWQSNHGLTADGIVGKMSWKAGLEAL